MSSSYSPIIRSCTRALHISIRPSLAARSLAIQCQNHPRRALRRYESTTASPTTNPKITTIVDQISQLTLLETADLVSNLKVRSTMSPSPPNPPPLLPLSGKIAKTTKSPSPVKTQHPGPPPRRLLLWPRRSSSSPRPSRRRRRSRARCRGKDALHTDLEILRRGFQAQGD